MTAASLVAMVAQDQVFRDTVAMIPAATDRSGWEVVVAGGQVVISLVVLVLLGAVVVMLMALRKTVLELTKLFHSSYGDISAAAHSVRNVAEDVRGITQTVKTDFGAVSDTIRQVNSGVKKVVRRTEWRLRRLDALVGVAQEEAEEFVLSSASALRGVRLGAAALRRTFQFTRQRGVKRRKRRHMRQAAAARAAERRAGTDRPRIRTRVVDPT